MNAQMNPVLEADGTAAVRLWPLRMATRRVVEPAREGLVALRDAALSDVPEISALLDGFARRGLLLPRTDAQLYRHFREFTVAADAAGVAGCGALKVYSQASAEIGALAVDARLHGQGIGRRIVEELIEQARAMGIARVFALTLQEGFFERLGFRVVNVAEFPEKIAADCVGCAKRSACIEIAVAMEL